MKEIDKHLHKNSLRDGNVYKAQHGISDPHHLHFQRILDKAVVNVRPFPARLITGSGLAGQPPLVPVR